MNKNLYRIVFNKRRGMLMVVGEHASSQGKAAAGESTGGGAGGGSGEAGTVSLLRPVGMALYAALGALAALPLHAQVVADPNAPGNQRPTVLTTSSGVAQVDIQAPSAAGVSRNTYSRFDVNSGGVILNNSRTDVQTQIGGWVSGNGSLAGGSARVILNEVNSSNPSRLGGFVEVAGQRAEVIIANPAGLQVDGGGFINASRVTLTTGTPIMNGGSLDGFMVQRGLVSFTGRGLDASATDYTAILARAVQVNAGIWAQDLRIVAGANQFDAAHAVTGKLAGSDGAPTFALDVAALGGMYAGKITLIGTEAGLGVRNAGTINATSGALVLHSDGWLGNSGALQATGAVELAAGGTVDNSGALHAGADARLASGGDIVNSGEITSGASTALRAEGALSTIVATSGSTLGASGALTLDATNGVAVHGTAAAAGATSVSGTGLDLAGAALSGATLALTASQGGIDARGATLTASGSLNASAVQTLRLDDAGVAAGQLALAARDLSNVGGDIAQLGAGDLALRLAGTLDNTGGRIATNSGNLTLAAATLANAGGTISHAGSGRLAIEAGRIDGQGGTLASNGSLDIATGAFDHRAASTNAAQVTLRAATLDNTGGSIAATGNADLSVAGQLANGGGRIDGGGSVSLSAAALANAHGRVAGLGASAITVGGAVDNTDGTLAGAALVLRAGDVDNTAGRIQAVGADGELVVGALNNTGGTVSAAGTLSTRAASLDNSGSLYAGADQNLAVSGALANSGMIAAGRNTTISGASVAGSADSLFGAGVTAGGALAASGTLDISAAGVLASHGQVLAAGDAVLGASAIDLSNSETQAARLSLSAATGAVDTRGAELAASGALTITTDAAAGQGWNNAGGAVTAGQLALQANTLDNAGGSIALLGGGATAIHLGGQATRLDNAGGSIAVAGNAFSLRADTIANTGGSIAHTGAGAFSLGGTLVDNSGGLLQSGGAFSFDAARFVNTAGQLRAGGAFALRTQGDLLSDGLLYAGGNARFEVGGTLANAGSIAARGNTVIIAGSVDSSGLLGAGLNSDGSLAASGDLSVSASGAIAASGEQRAAGRLALGGAALDLRGSDTTARDIALDAAGDIDTRGALVAASGSLTASSAAGALRNTAGQISGAAIDIEVAALENTGGDILQSGGGQLQVATGRLDNTAGQILGDGSIAIDAATVINAGGKVAGAAGLAMHAGDVDNSTGQLRSGSGDVTLAVRDLVNADGSVHAGANLAAMARQVVNSGSLYAGASQTLNASGSVANSGVIAAGGNTSIGAASLASSGLLGAGLKADGSFAATGVLDVATAGALQAGGRNLAAGGVQMAGADLDLSSSLTTGAAIALGATSGNIDTSAALLTTTGTLRVDAAGTGQALNNQGGVLSAGQLDLHADAIDNTDGAILQTGSGDTTIETQLLENTAGRIAVNSANLTLDARLLRNLGGELEHAGNGRFILRAGPLDNRYGSIVSGGTLDLAATGYLDNTAGAISAATDLRLQGSTVDNTSGLIHASGGKLDVSAALLLNTDGELSSGGDLQAAITGDLLSNGLMYAGGNQVLGVGGILINDGAIVSLGNTTITAGALDSTGLLGAGMHDDGSFAASGSLSLRGAEGVVASGQNLAAGDVAITGAGIDLSGSETAGAGVALDALGGKLATSNAVVAAAGLLAIDAAQLENTSGELAGNAVTVNVARLDNVGGTIIAGGAGEMRVDAGALDNTGGSIASTGGSLRLGANDVDNTDGLLSGSAGLVVNALDVANAGGDLRSARGSVDLNLRDLDNSGAVFAASSLSTTARNIANSGSLYAGASQRVSASGAVTSSGAIAAGANLDIEAASLAASDLLGAGVKADGSLGTDGALTVATAGLLQAGGQNLAAGSASLQGGAVDLANSDTSAANISLAAASGNVDTRGALVTTSGTLVVTAAAGSSLNAGGVLSAGQLDLRVDSLNNAGGTIFQTGSGDTTIAATLIDNEGGRIAVNSRDLTLDAAALHNAGGRIEHAGSGTLTVQADAIGNQFGRISSEGAANVAGSAVLANNGGVIAARDLGVKGGAIDNSAGLMAATGGALALDGASLLNTDGELSAAAGLRLDLTGNLTSNGLLYAGANAQLNVGGLLRNDGSLAAFGNTTINAGSVQGSGLFGAGLDENGGFGAGGDLSIASSGALASSGQNLAAGAATLHGSQVDLSGSDSAADSITISATSGNVVTNGALVQTAGALDISGAALVNAGGELRAGALSLDVARLDNSGDIVQTAGDLALDVGALTNTGGRITAAAGSLDLQGSTLDNAGGLLVAANGMRITTGLLKNAGGQVEAAGGNLTLALGRLENGAAGSIYAAGNLDTTAGSVANSGSLYAAGSQDLAATGALVSDGVIGAFGDLAINAGSLAAGDRALFGAGLRADGTLRASGEMTLATTGVLQSAGQNLAGGNAVFTGAALDLAGSETSAANLTLASSAGKVDTSGALLTTPGRLDITANGGNLVNAAGTLSGGQLAIDVDGFDNTDGTILQSGSGDTTLSAGQLTNTRGRIGVNSRNFVVQAGTLDNAGGRIEHAGSGSLQVRATTIDNTAGRLSSAAAADIAATAALVNTGGVIAGASALRVGGGALVNDGGLMQATSGVLNVTGASLSSLGGELSAGGDLNLTLDGDLASTGLLYAGGNALLDVDGVLRNAGSLAALGNLTVNAGSVASDGLFGAGMRADGSLAAGGNLAVTSTGALRAGGENFAAGSVTLRGATLDLVDSDTAGASITLGASAGNIDTTDAVIGTAGSLAVTASAPGATLVNRRGELSGALVNLAVSNLVNAGGTVQQTGAGEMALDVNALDNRGGRIVAATGRLAIDAASVDNTDGRLAAATGLSIDGADLINTGGEIEGVGGDVTLHLGDITNTGGSIYAGANLATTARNLDNGGSLYAAGNQRFDAAGAVTNGGVLAAQGNLTVTAASFNGGSLSLLGAGMRADGTLGTSGTLDVSASGALTAAGQHLAGGDASFAGASLNLAGSQTGATNLTLTARSGEIDTSYATLTAAGTLTVGANANYAQRWNNVHGDILAAQLQVQAANLNNTDGTLVQTGAGNTVINLGAPSASFDNTRGRIAVNSANLTLGANSFINVDGTIEHAGAGTLAINTARFDGLGSDITGNGAFTLNAAAIDHRYGTLYAQQLAISGSSLDNTGGKMVGRGAGQTTLGISQALTNTGGTIASNGNTGITAGSLTNTGGDLQASGSASLTLSVSGLLANTGEGGIAAGGNTTITAGSVDNRGGTATAAGALSLTTGGALDNAGGTLASEGALYASAASLDNTGGQLASVQGGLSAQTSGASINTNGRIQAAGNVSLTNAGLVNNGGTVSGRDLSLNTNGQGVNNYQGTLAASLAANLQTGALNNDGGRIQSGTTLLVDTHGQALTNTNAGLYAQRQPGYNGGITGGTATTLYAGGMNNTAGFLGAGGQLGGNVGYLTNNWGEIGGMAGIGLDIAGLNNTNGRIQSLGGLSLSAGGAAIGNSNGLLRAGGALSLYAGSIDNGATQGQEKGIEGQDVALTTPSLNNYGGALRANNNLTVSSAGSVENSWGLVSAGNALTIADPNGYRGLAIYNTGGIVIGGQSATLRAASLSGAGRVLSQRDLLLDLAGDYALDGSGELVGNGNVTVNLGGGLWNYGRLQAAGTLTVNATALDNSASGDINAGTTRLNAGSWLTNRGVIDGINTEINTGTLTNLGTGRIYGDRISIGAGALVNDVEGGTAGTIAARSYMAIGAGSINNREHALIFSGGDMAIGGGIDWARNAYGTANSLTNASATIEALGSMTINAGRIDVLNNRFSTTSGDFGPAESYSEYVIGDVRYSTSSGAYVERVPDNSVNGDHAELVAPDGRRYDVFEIHDTYRSTASTVVLSSDPGVIAAGTDLTVNTSAALNENSQITAGRTLAVTPDALTNRFTASQTVIRESVTINYFEPDRRIGVMEYYEDNQGPRPPETFDRPDVVIDNGGAFAFQRTPVSGPGAKAGVAVNGTVSAARGATVGQAGQVTVSGPTGSTGVATAAAGMASAAAGAVALDASGRLGTAAQAGPLGMLVQDVSTAVLGGTQNAGATGAVAAVAGVNSAAPLAGVLGNAIDTAAGAIGSAALGARKAAGAAGGIDAVAGAQNAAAIAVGTGAEPGATAAPIGQASLAARKEVRSAGTVDGTAAAPLAGAIVATGSETKVSDSVSAAPSGTTLAGAAGAAPGAGATAPKPGTATPNVRGIAQVPLTSPTATAEVVRTRTTAPVIPNASLYQVSPAPEATFLVQTDPRFADYREWTSADYLIGKVSTDPSVTQKRLGDGFYEQQLIREQMTALTGYRYSANYTSDEEQYRGLMDAAASFADTWNLRPGLALTPAQMAALTSDIVWLVEQDVALADGSTQKVLVPQVYVRVREGDLDGSGALLSGRNVDIALSGDLVNSGTIAGREVVRITAENVDNLSGRIHGGDVALQARNDLNNISGTISANSMLVATAGRDLNNVTGVAGIERAGGTASVLGRVAGLYVTGDASGQGSMLASAGRDLNLAGSIVSNAAAGTSSLIAGRNVTLGGAFEQNTSATDGTVHTVATRASQLTGAGAFAISAGNDLQIANSAVNAGSLLLRAGNDITNIGSSISADRELIATAGRDINLRTTTVDSAYGRNVANTSIGSVAGLYVNGTGPDSRLIVSAGRDINLAAGIIGNAGEGGTTAVSALRDLNLGTVGVSSRNDLVTNANNYRKESTTSEVGSQISAAGIVLLKAGNNLSVRASEVDAGTALNVAAGNNIDIIAGVATTSLDMASQTTKKKTFSKKVTTKRDTVDTTTAIASALTGNTVSMSAGNDLNVTGSAVVGDESVALTAGNDINIAAAVNTNREWNHVEEKKSGFLSGGGGFGISYGTRTTTTDQNKDAVTQSGLARSMVGSIGGNLTLDAGNAIKVGGTDMSAGQDISLAGKSVTIDPGKDQIDGKMETRTVQDALTLKVGGTVVSAIQAVQSVQQTAEATGNKRVQAMAAATAAIAAKNAAADIAKEGGPSVSLSLTAGHSESVTTRTTSETLHTGSILAAGNDLTIVAKGDGVNSDINIVGSQLSAGRNVTLAATDQVNLLAAQDLESQHSESKSFSAEAGVKATVGTNGMAFGVTASVSGSRGHEDGSGTTQVNSSVKAAEKLTIVSGGDTNIKGAVAAGAQVVATVGGDLNIESLQDTAKFDSKTQSASISGTFGAGASVSGSFSQSSIKSDYASVQEQSGIRAGDGGFQINVGGNTGLKGGVISSTADGVAANMLTTRTLTESDIANYAKMQATSIGLSGTVTSGGGDSKPKTGEQAASTAPPAGQGQGPGGTNLIDVANTSAPTGVTPSGVALSSNDKSTTSSGISAGTIVITDDAAQRALTGKGAEEAIAALGRDVVAGTDSSGRINNSFDQAATQTALRVTEEFVATAAPLAAKLVGDLGTTKQKEAEAAAKSFTKQAGEAAARGDNALVASLTAQADAARATAAAWSDDGVNRVALHAATQGAIRGLGGGGAGALSGVSGVVGGDLGKQLGEYLANAQATGLTEAERVSLVNSYKQTMATVGGAVAGLVTSAGTGQTGAESLAGAVQSGITGSTVDKNNRQLHMEEADKLALLKKGKSPQEQHRLDAAACALVHCADGVPLDDPNYARLARLQMEGASYKTEQQTISATGKFHYEPVLDRWRDGLTRNGETVQRTVGGINLLGGTAGMVGGGTIAAIGVGSCSTILGCALIPAGAAIAVGGNQQAQDGNKALFGSYQSTEGQRVLDSFNSRTYPGEADPLKDAGVAVVKAAAVPAAGKLIGLAARASSGSAITVKKPEVERGLGGASGHDSAKEVLPGGSGQALAGHGVMEGNATIIGNGSFTSPPGTTVITPRPGIRIAESTGQLLENVTSVKQLDDILVAGTGPTGPLIPRNYQDLKGYNVFAPGESGPNYTLLNPGYGGKNLVIFKNSTTTEKPTHLSDFLQPNMGCVIWAACTEVVPFVPRKP